MLLLNHLPSTPLPNQHGAIEINSIISRSYTSTSSMGDQIIRNTFIFSFFWSFRTSDASHYHDCL